MGRQSYLVLDLFLLELQYLVWIENPMLKTLKTAISTTPLPGYGDVAIKKQPNYKGSFAEMAKKGIKITSYDVGDGAGRPIHDDE
jgi:hypothetical protein